MSEQLSVFVVFILVFAGIVLEKLDKTAIVLAGALFLVMFGYLDFEHAIHAVDFHTICLLLGMMVIVCCLNDVRLFEWTALRLGLMTRGSPVLIFVTFGFATAVFSAFLDNVTTVLIIVPLVISLARGMGLDPRPFVLCSIFLSNLGGAATLIGDPPNLLIGSQVKTLTFAMFIQYLTAPVIVSCAIAMLYLRWINRATVKSRSGTFNWLFLSNLTLEDIQRQAAELKIPASVGIRAAAVGGLVLVGFFSHAATHIEPSVVAMTGATLMLIVFHKELDLHKVIAHVEWPTLLFFAGLFVVVGAVEHVGLLEMVANFLMSLTQDVWVLLMLILWVSAILSGIVDNIPFVAVMIPVLQKLEATEPFASDPNTGLVWWALALGACFGGNATAIGASANVISVAIARSKGIEITFTSFLRESLPVTFMSIVVSSVYLSILYYV